MAKAEMVRQQADALDSQFFSREHIDLIKRTLASEHLTDLELDLFLHQCKRTGLDPLSRQIYAVKRSGKLVIQTGIDGYRAIADRTGAYAGSDDAVFDEWEGTRPGVSRVTVYKIVQGVRCAFTASARWDEYYPGKSQGWAWDKMPHVMLSKVAEALALRKAFPQDLSGVYTTEEMERAGRAQASVEAGEVADKYHLEAQPGTKAAAQELAQIKIAEMHGIKGPANNSDEEVPAVGWEPFAGEPEPSQPDLVPALEASIRAAESMKKHKDEKPTEAPKITPLQRGKFWPTLRGYGWPDELKIYYALQNLVPRELQISDLHSMCKSNWEPTLAWFRAHTQDEVKL